MFAAMPALPPEAMNGEFATMMTIMKVFMFVLAMGLSYLCFWIIYKLTAADIKTEFIGTSAADMGETAPIPGSGAADRRRSNTGWIIAVILTVALGIYYFSTGNIKPADYNPDIHRLKSQRF